MTHLLEIGLTNAAVATLLAVVVWLVTRVRRHPAFVHALWAVVLLKLITPPMIAIPWQFSLDAVPAEQDLFSNNSSVAAADPVITSLGDGTSEPMLIEQPADPRGQPDRVSPVAEIPQIVHSDTQRGADVESRPRAAWSALVPRMNRVNLMNLVMFVWLAGSAVWFIVSAARLLQFQRALANTVPPSDELQQRVDAVAKKLGVARGYLVRVTDGHVSPMVWSFGRPMILLPSRLSEEFSDAEMDSLLAHEFAHLRRKDHWVRWLELIVATIYWWHPVVWWARAVIERAGEQACDAWVVSTFPDVAKRYAAAIFKVVEFSSANPQALPIVASGLGSRGNLKERIEHVLNTTWHGRLDAPARIFLLLFALLMLPLSLRAVFADEATDETNSEIYGANAAATETVPSETSDGAENVLTVLEPTAYENPTIDAPLVEQRIGPGSMLLIQVAGTPINDGYHVDSDGHVLFGQPYGRVLIGGLTIGQAEAAIKDHLKSTLADPTSAKIRVLYPYRIAPGEFLVVRVVGALPDAPIADLFLVEQSGSVPLGPHYGRVKIAGLTLEEAEEAIDKHLSKVLSDPTVMVTSGNWQKDRFAVAARTSNTPTPGTTRVVTDRYAVDTGEPPRSKRSGEESEVLREHVKFLTDDFKRIDVLYRTERLGLDTHQMAGYELAAAEAELAWAEGRVKDAIAHFAKARNLAESARKAVTASYQAGRTTHDVVLMAANNLSHIKRRLIRAGQSLAAAPATMNATEPRYDYTSVSEAGLSQAADVPQPTASIDFLTKMIDTKREVKKHIVQAYEKGEISGLELMDAALEEQISRERLRQAKLALEYRKLQLELAENDYHEAIKANEQTPGTLPKAHLRRLKIKFEMAKIKVRELSD